MEEEVKINFLRHSTFSNKALPFRANQAHLVMSVMQDQVPKDLRVVEELVFRAAPGY